MKSNYMMSKTEVNEMLARYGVIVSGHFVLTSGRHADCYVNKDAIYTIPAAISMLCDSVASLYVGRGIEVVAAPAVGGVILSQWVAYHLGANSWSVSAVYAEKDATGRFAFHRGYDRIVRGKAVLVVEDILTTGGSLRDVIRATVEAGGKVAGVAALVNRGGVTAKDVGSPVPLLTLTALDLASHAEADCPLCKAGVPINVEVGKGREFLERKK